MIIKSKKAQAGELISNTFALILIVFLLIVFFVLSSVLWGFSSKEIKTITAEQSIHNQEHYSLYSLLQKTIEIEIEGKKQNLTFSDLIRLSKINKDYEKLLEEETKKALDEHYDYKFELMSKEDVKLKMGFDIISIAGTITAIPTIKGIKGSSFYLPSNRIIAANLEIKNIKK